MRTSCTRTFFPKQLIEGVLPAFAVAGVFATPGLRTKSFLFLFVALCLASVAYSQQRTTVFENASLAKANDGTPCMLLNWKKGPEATDYYLVERSSDGKTFKQIALVFTAEDPAFCDFAFRDKEYTTSGQNVYYRLALVNKRKEVSYLPIKKAALTSTDVTELTVGSGDALVARK